MAAAPAAPGVDPLAGVRVVVTRAEHQAESTVAAFRAAGAHVELLPLLELAPPADAAPLDAALACLERFHWIVFTSVNAVDCVLGRLGPAGLPGGLRVASIGSATSAALRGVGIAPDLEPADARAEGLATELVARLRAGGPDRPRLLLPQAADARPVLAEALRRAGFDAVRVDAYAKRVPPGAARRARAIFGSERFGWVTFTSPSIAHAFAALWGGEWQARSRSLLAASIGPVTSGALRELGVEPAAEAVEPADDALVAAVGAAVSARP